MGENLLEWILGIVGILVAGGIVGLIIWSQTVAVLKNSLVEFKQEYLEARKGHALLHEHERNEFQKDYDHLHMALSALRERVSDAVTNEKLNAMRHEENAKRLAIITDKLERIEVKR